MEELRVNKKMIYMALALLMVTMSLLAQQVNDFTLTDANNNEVKLSDHLGKGIVILDFWATWCQPCMKLLPEMDKIQSEFEDVTILAINVDTPRLLNKAKAQVRSQKYSFLTLFDTNQTVMKRFQVTTIPHTFILDSTGKILFEHTGYSKGDEVELREKILSFLQNDEEETE